MNFIGKTVAGIIAASSVMVPVQANTFEDHTELARAVASTGVKLLINVPACQTENSYGWYNSRKSQLVICQENATDEKMVMWTAEDLDTLRHEAHHVVQDCIDNVLDGKLEAVYVEPAKLIGHVLNEEQIAEILEWYEDATDNRKLMELEAFSVAIINDPLEQVADINKYCF